MQLSSRKLFQLLSILVVAAMVLTGCTAVAPAARLPRRRPLAKLPPPPPTTGGPRPPRPPAARA